MLVRAPSAITASQVRQVAGVKDAFEVMGRFDCVALLDVEDMSALKKAVFKIQRVKGVGRTESLLEVA